MNLIERVTVGFRTPLLWPQAVGQSQHYGAFSASPESAEGLWQALSASETALAELPNLEHFTTYQHTVRNILQAGLARCTVRAETYRSPKGRFQRLVYVTAVDRELAKLRHALLAEHVGTGILQHFDAIRGILLDLFT